MKIPGSFYRLFIPCFVAAILIFSCKKENSGRLTDAEELQANLVSSESDAEASALFNGLFDDVMGANNLKNEVGLQGPSLGIFGVSSIGSQPSGSGTSRTDTLPSCASVTVLHLNGTGFPVKIITEFSSSGCLCNDGRVRRGKIITVYTDRLSIAGATATTNFENYWIDSIHVEGTHTIANSTPLNADLQYTIDVSTKLSKTNGNYTEWHSHYVMKKSLGIVSYPLSQEFKIWPGFGSGKVKRDNILTSWRAEVIDTLVKRYNCHWISKGRVRIVRENLPSGSPWIGILDYGFPNNGNCDNRAKLVVNGTHVYEITLR